jgi:hypothetical protein
MFQHPHGIFPLLEGYFPEGSFVWLTFCYSVVTLLLYCTVQELSARSFSLEGGADKGGGGIICVNAERSVFMCKRDTLSTSPPPPHPHPQKETLYKKCVFFLDMQSIDGAPNFQHLVSAARSLLAGDTYQKSSLRVSTLQ